MGVRGLFTYLQRRCSHTQARELRVHLGKFACEFRKSPGCAEDTAKLLCDFYSVLFWLLSEFQKAKIKHGDYQRFSYLYGGDMVEYEQRFFDFVSALRYLGIEPIFYIDGARGSDGEGFKAKLPTYIERHTEGDMKNIVHCNRIARYDPKEEVDCSLWFRHPLIPLHIMMALRSKGVKLEHCIGEADAYLARRAQSGQHDICGILTNDTDLIMMRGCEVFLCQFFDIDNELGIRSTHFNCRPSEVVCSKINASTLAKMFRIPENQLKNLSVICGNDYTKSLNKTVKLNERLSLCKPYVESAATWLRELPHTDLLKLPQFKEIDESSEGEYSKAIKHTYVAYGEATPGPHDPPSQVYEMIRNGVNEGRMMRELLSMVAHNSVHWRKGVVEIVVDPDSSSTISTPPSDTPCIDDMLLPIRRIIYKLLGMEKVMEYGRSKTDHYCETLVKVTPTPRIAFFQNLMEKKKLERICLLATFSTKARGLKDVSFEDFQVPAVPEDVDHTFIAILLQCLVVCTALLVSYELRNDSNSFSLDHVPDVFLVTCFMCILEKSPRKVHSRPTPETTEVATGYSCIIKHLYHLASLLGLFEMMPRPAEMYQSAAFIPFYAIPTSKPSSIKHQLRANAEMAETHNAYNYIIQLDSFTNLKALIEKIYQGSKSSLESFTPRTLMGMVIAFLEVLADIDEADKQSCLFVQEEQSCDHPKEHKKGKKGEKGKSKHKKSTKQVQKGGSIDSGAACKVMGERSLYREEIDKLRTSFAGLLSDDDFATTEDCATSGSDSDDCHQDM